MNMPAGIARIIEKMNPDMSGLTSWEKKKLDNHAMDLQAKNERVIVRGKPNNRAAKRARAKATK